MTTKEMLIDVQQKTSKSNGNQNRKLQDEQILWFLNDSVMLLFGSHLIPNKEGFIDVSEIYYNFYLPFINIDYDLTKEDANTYVLPDESLFILGGVSIVNNERLPITSIKSSVVNIVSRTPFYKGGTDFINVIQFKNKLKVLTVDVIIQNLFINYLRKPNQITLNDKSEVIDLYHQDIVNMTVETILANVNDVEGYRMRKEINNNNQILIK